MMTRMILVRFELMAESTEENFRTDNGAMLFLLPFADVVKG